MNSLLLFLCCLPAIGMAEMLAVGAGKTHSTIEAAYTAASPGDTILVYPPDFSKKRLFP